MPKHFKGALYDPECPKGAVQSSSGAPQMPHPSAQEGQSIRSHNAGCGGEGPFDSSCPCKKGLITRTQGGRAYWPTCPQQSTHFKAQGSYLLKRTSPHMEVTATSTPWIYHFMGRWVWPAPKRTQPHWSVYPWRPGWTWALCNPCRL